MSLQLGIVGLPNVGKSTLFNALTKAQNAQAANYPFCTIEPNKATVPVPDHRLEEIASIVSPQKVIQTTVDFIDIAGLVKGASKGEGLGNQFLAHIRECSVILQVVRCFDNENITHVEGSVDPIRDIETIETELLLADIQTVTQRIERLQKIAKNNKDAKMTVEEMNLLLLHLNSGNPASTFNGKKSEKLSSLWKELGLLTDKRIIYCANVDETSLIDSNDYLNSVKKIAEKNHTEMIVICAKIEEELQGLSDEEQAEILNSYNIEKSGLVQIIQTGYNALGLISYFTAGEKEVRAWTIEKGWKAPQAAGVIHSDFERGFIRAEVMSISDFLQYKSEAACRNAGVLRTEGKDYIVTDGDIIHFLFNV